MILIITRERFYLQNNKIKEMTELKINLKYEELNYRVTLYTHCYNNY